MEQDHQKQSELNSLVHEETTTYWSANIDFVHDWSLLLTQLVAITRYIEPNILL